MSWFKCDDNGNLLINMGNVIKVLANTTIPELKGKQDEILSTIQDITSGEGDGLSPDQMSQILNAISAIPSDLLVENQNTIADKLTTADNNLSDIKTTVDDIKNTSLVSLSDNQTNILNKLKDDSDTFKTTKELLDLMYNSLDDSIEGILTAGETSIELTSSNLVEGTQIEVYTSKYDESPNSVIVSDGKVTLTFDEQTEDMGVKVVFKRHIDWSKVTITNETDTSANHE